MVNQVAWQASREPAHRKTKSKNTAQEETTASQLKAETCLKAAREKLITKTKGNHDLIS
jgi:hypothetical protein